ncbi:MAG: methyltransferase domain-containing protein [Timaviella obliquedivisa GSE-PSE-MK23-08B]|jgi:SAM-dependent methyltransferase|nr:methyltransferase domain-containing protein [Timaviella obliquedivisa GSE-PSE-MK23-08B]
MQTKIDAEQPEVQQLQNQLKRLKRKLQQVQKEHNYATSIITAMESSKFWQLRNAWFELKKSLRLGKDNFHETRSLPQPRPDTTDLLSTPTELISAVAEAPIKALPLEQKSIMELTREHIAELYLKGQGIEIGALNHPLAVPEGVKVLYVDRMSVADLRQQYPELNDIDLVEADILANGEELETIADVTQDFVIANHFIEHCQDTIGAIHNMLRVLKPGGILYTAIPDKRFSFDVDRQVTSLEHIWRDHTEGPAWSKRQHFEGWVRHVGKKQDEADIAREIDHLIEIDYSIHYHVFTQTSWLKLFVDLQQNLSIKFDIELVFKNGAYEVVLIARRLP